MKKILMAMMLLGALLTGLVSPAVASPQTTTTALALPAPTKLLLTVFENKPRPTAEKRMPYMLSMQKRFAYATKLFACCHPSEPNYFMLSMGDDFGITNDKGPNVNGQHGQTVFGNAIAHGKTAKDYGDGQTDNCPLANQGQYWVVRHVIWAFALDERSLCNQFQVPMAGNFNNDLATGLPNLSWLIGSNQHNAHTPSTALDADNWLKTWLPDVMASDDWQQSRLAVVITFDEGSSSNQNVSGIVIYKPLDQAHLVVTDPLVHHDLYKWMLRIGNPALTGPDMGTAFGL